MLVHEIRGNYCMQRVHENSGIQWLSTKFVEFTVCTLNCWIFLHTCIVLVLYCLSFLSNMPTDLLKKLSLLEEVAWSRLLCPIESITKEKILDIVLTQNYPNISPVWFCLYSTIAKSCHDPWSERVLSPHLPNRQHCAWSDHPGSFSGSAIHFRIFSAVSFAFSPLLSGYCRQTNSIRSETSFGSVANSALNSENFRQFWASLKWKFFQILKRDACG